ncbi:hypothetical protein Hdeb2414_s0006g00210971 [Helianthus debilis subsp. tardiflorus]
MKMTKASMRIKADPAITRTRKRNRLISYLGGLKCMIVFKEKRQALEFIEKEAPLWSSVIAEAVLWRGQNLIYNRLVWLTIEGVPIHLRDNRLFDRIGARFGTVVGGSEFSWTLSDNSCGRCWLLVEEGCRINEEISVTWSGNSYRVWVYEDQNLKLDSIVKEMSSTHRVSPAKSVDSCTGYEEELEDGEFNRDKEELPEVNDRSSPQIVSSENHRGLGTGDEPLVVSDKETSLSGSRNVHGGNIQNLEKEAARKEAMQVTRQRSGDVVSESGATKNNTPQFNKTSGLENSQNLGPARSTRKRTWSQRSPITISPQELFPEPITTEEDKNDAQSFDLNNPLGINTLVNDGAQEESVCNITSKGIEDEVMSDMQDESNGGFNGDEGGTQVHMDAAIREETNATITVGSKVAFKLGGFSNQDL